MSSSRDWDSFAGALASGRDSDVRDALREITLRIQSGAPVTLESPSHEWLEELDQVGEDTLKSFLDLLYTRPFLVPRPSDDIRRHEALEANLRHGTHGSAMHHALLLATADTPAVETTETLLQLIGRGTRSDAETTVAKYLVSNLLDSPRTREATIGSLGWMLDHDTLDEVVQYVRPQLEPEELAELDE